MAKGSNAPPLPPSPEACERVLETVRSAIGPVTATELRKRLDPSVTLPAKALAPILEDAVTSGKLLRLPPKSAKGPPRYWDRDPRVILRAAVVQAIESAAAPFTAKDLISRLKPLKVTEPEVLETLRERVGAGTLHEIPPADAKKKERYGKQTAIEVGEMTLRDALQAKGPQPEVALRKVVKWLGEAQFRQVIERGLAARRLWRHPPLTPAGKELLGAAPPSPEPYLKKVGEELTKAIGRCLAADMPRDALRRALVQLIEAAGVPFAGPAVSPGATTRDGHPSPSTGVDLVALMRRIEPGADRGALIGARDLRRAAQIEKQQFDRAVLELAREGRLSLHRHDFVASLTRDEQDDLVTDGQGAYYVGIALRQSNG